MLNGDGNENGRKKNRSKSTIKRARGDSAYERGGDARRLAQGCKFRILVSLRVFWEKRPHI